MAVAHHRPVTLECSMTAPVASQATAMMRLRLSAATRCASDRRQKIDDHDQPHAWHGVIAGGFGVKGDTRAGFVRKLDDGSERWDAAQCVTVALPLMRAQQDGLIIHTASMAGRFIGGFPGPLYTAAKHGVVAMSHSINMQECVNGIRSCVFLPGEVATPILDQRPNPVGPEERARMVQPQDCADLILYIALLPKRLTMNEVMLSPTWNRAYVAAIRQLSNL